MNAPPSAGLIVAVGVSNLQFVDMNSSRNLFIFGFSFFTGLTVSEWMKDNPTAIDTGTSRHYNNTYWVTSYRYKLTQMRHCMFDVSYRPLVRALFICLSNAPNLLPKRYCVYM